MNLRYRSQYLRSKHWRQRRARYLRDNGGWCRACYWKGRGDIHHRDYSNLGYEPDEDLVCLRRSCHKTVHRYIDSGKYRTRREATFVAIRDIRADKKRWQKRRRTAAYAVNACRRVKRALSVLWI